MKNIFIYHLYAFLAGAVTLAGYFYWKTAALQGTAELAVVVLWPVAVVYIIALGIFCIASCILWTSIVLIRRWLS